MTKRSIKAEREYEARKSRPGVQVSLRWSDEEIERIDAERGSTPRAEFLKEAVRTGRRWNAPAKRG